MQLEDKTAIVTGGSRDIGRAISEKLASEGASVAINYCHSRENADETVASITAAGGRAVAIAADMTSGADVDRLVAETLSAFDGKIDILVNNVGGLVARKTLAEMDEAFFDAVMAVNLKSTFLACRSTLPCLGNGASIVNMASIAGRDGGGPGAAAYATAKGAIMSFTRALAKETGPQGIRVNCICPGLIATSYHDRFTTDDARRKTVAGTPLRREGKAAEVADLVAYLASAEASFINGASIDINGGLLFS
jgi:3-oxoacyl-[acyl-carrier protein] reductase